MSADNLRNGRSRAPARTRNCSIGCSPRTRRSDSRAEARVLGQGRTWRIERELPLGIERNGHWPVKKLLCEGNVHGAVPRLRHTGRPPAPTCVQIGQCLPRIAVEAQVVGADGVPDDQETSAGAGVAAAMRPMRDVPDRLTRPDDNAARNRQDAEEPTRADRASREGWPRFAILRQADLPRLPGAGYTRRTAASATGPLQIASVASSHAPGAAKQPGRSRFTAATITPGTSNSTACRR